MRRGAIQFAPYRERFLFWWKQRTTRERMLLLLMVGLLGAFALVSFAIRPLQATRAAAIADIRTYDLLAARLRASANVPASANRRTGNTAAIVQSSASQFGLVVRSVTGSGRTVRVQMAAMPYDAVVRWLADLDQSSNLRVRRISLLPAPAAGTVDADMVLSS